jgi:hypothetical protein
LERFDSASLSCVFSDLEVGDIAPRVLVDAVLGLPRDITSQNHKHADFRSSLRDALLFFKDHLKNGEIARGRGAAEAYFQGVLRAWSGNAQGGSSGLPAREAERLAGANSVFLTRPYQKNVQTGTYRIWIELAQWLAKEGMQAVHFPHHDPSAPLPVSQWSVEESWPSLLWRTLFGCRTRKPAEFGNELKRLEKKLSLRLVCSSEDLDFCAKHPDHADALILALGGILLPRSKSEGLKGEGWITGLKKIE